MIAIAGNAGAWHVLCKPVTLCCHVWLSGQFQHQIKLPMMLYPALLTFMSHWCCAGQLQVQLAKAKSVALVCSSISRRLRVGPAGHSIAPRALNVLHRSIG